MSPSLDQMIEWAGGELSLSLAQGIGISDLFHRLDQHHASSAADASPLDGATKNRLWEALAAREDLSTGEGQSATALKKLSLDEILGLGLGERKIKLLVAAEADQANTPGPRALDAFVHPLGGEHDLSETIVVSTDQPGVAPKPKRRGRPPKNSTRQLDPQRPATQITEASLGYLQSTSSAALDSPLTVPLDHLHSPRSSSRHESPIGITIAEDNPTPRSIQPPGPTPTRKRGRPSRASLIKRATYTPQEEVQREEDDAKIEAGIPGVYINPTVSQAPREALGRNPKTGVIAVFKSAKLKIPQWLVARKGTWKDAFTKKTGTDPLHVIPARHSASLKRKELHGVSNDTSLHPDLEGAHPTKKFAGPQTYNQHAPIYDQQLPLTLPPPSNSLSSYGPAAPHQESKPTTTVASQSSHWDSHATYQSPFNLVPMANMTQKPIYKSPYSFNSPASLPVAALLHTSPYHLTNPPSEPTSLQIGSLASSTSIPRAEYPSFPPGSVLKPNAQPTPKSGDKSEAFVPPIPESFNNIERRWEMREQPVHADIDGRDERYKFDLFTSKQSSPMLGSGSTTAQPFLSMDPQERSLEHILKQQDEERQKEIQKERELQNKLSAAEGAEVPEHSTRLAAAYDNAVGNLILSPNQSTLYFVSLHQQSPESHTLVLPVSMISGNPIVSIAGSKPMELRVKSRDDTKIEITHCFNVGQTALARIAADVMRSKLVLAKLNIQATTTGPHNESGDDFDTPPIGAPKPFSCETCSKTFKNKVGHLYHITKSQTTCNPSFDPSTERKPGGRKPKKKVAVDPSKMDNGHSVRNQPVDDGRKVQDDNQSDGASDESVDSIIEWAERVSRPQTRSTVSRRQREHSNRSADEHPSISFYSDEDGSDHESDQAFDDGLESMEDDTYHIEETTAEKRKRNMQETWARAKAMGGNTLANLGKKNSLQTGTRTLRSQVSSFNTPKKTRIPLTEEEKQRRAIRATHREQYWDAAPSYLPNIETGAWDQKPQRVRKVHRKPMRRQELPEPVTYMQDEVGAWSIRPFGHGVKPIYARPARRADGNPSLPQYLERIGNGFRPVLIPTKNRLYLPALPSKALIGGRTSNDPSPIAADFEDASESLPRRRRRRRPQLSVTPEDGEDGEDGDDQDYKVRISKLTGKPVRPYRKEKDRVVVGIAPTLNGGSNLLNILEPQKVSPTKGKLSNPGLYSLPVSFGLGFSKATDDQDPLSNIADVGSSKRIDKEIPPKFSLREILADVLPSAGTELSQPRILSDIHEVAMWEQGRGCKLLCSGSVRPNYCWVNHTIDFPEGAIDMEHVKISWDENRSFDMVTVPYMELDESEEIPLFNLPSTPHYRVPRSSLKPASRNARDLRELHKGWTTRRLTALSSDLAGLGDDPEQVAKEFGAQIAKAPTSSRTRNGGSYMSAADEARLIVGVCVLRTLTGGLDQNIDWVLVATLFDRFSMNFLTRRWTTLFQKKRVVIEKLMGDFQEAFLPAYEKGEIPPLNYDKLVQYDWAWLVDWAMKRVDMTLGTKAIDLPDTQERLQKLYHIKENNFENARQDGYFSLSYPVYKRMELASSVPNTLSNIIQPAATCADDIKISNLMLVKSWVRAAALTSEDAWDPSIMKRKLKTLETHREDRNGNDPKVKNLVDQAAEILRNDKVLMQRNRGRAGPSRTYEPTDAFFGGLRKHLTVKQFVDAMNFKCYLDQEFSRGTECIRSDYLANEGTLMCVTQLQAYGRIRLKAVGVPMNKFGLMDGGYETRKIPKEKFRFDMDIYPTERYVYDSNNEVLHRFKQTKPPRGSKLGEIPVWYDISDRLIPDLWHKVLVAFVGIIALRAGINIQSLKTVFNPTLEEWEIRRLIEWGAEYGLFVRVHELVDGWTTGEWWWLMVGWCCSGEI